MTIVIVWEIDDFHPPIDGFDFGFQMMDGKDNGPVLSVNCSWKTLRVV
jgi:hypothetical protein